MQFSMLRLRIALVLMFLVVCLVKVMHPESSVNELWLMPYEWVLLLTLVFSSVFFFFNRQSLTRRDRLEFVLWNLAMLTFAAILYLSALTGTFAWTLRLALRALVFVAWAFVLLVGVYLFQRLRRSLQLSDQSTRSLGLLGKCWFSTALTLCLLEGSCVVLKQLQLDARAKLSEKKLELPGNLPTPPAGEWHLAAIGGSTMLGWPYQPHVSIPQLASRTLIQQTQGRSESSEATKTRPPRVVVHNLALAGINFRQAVRELNTLQYRPQCLLVYSGHNEFYHEIIDFSAEENIPSLALDRWWKLSPTIRVFDELIVTQFKQDLRLSPELRSLIDHPLASNELLASRVERFYSHLEELALYCQQNKIQTVWFIPAAAEAGFEPNRSVLPADSSAKQQQKLIQLYEQARSAEQRGDHSFAKELYQSGIRDFPGFAEFHYRYGLCLLKMEEFTEAQRHFSLALEFDAYPVRMQAAYREAIQNVAEKYSIATIDAASNLRSHTPHGILDRSVFLDDVHPNIKGISVLANSATQVLAGEFMKHLALTPSEWEPLSVQEILTTCELTTENLAKSYARLAAGLELRCFLRFDTEFRNQEVKRFQKISERLRTGQITPEEAECFEH